MKIGVFDLENGQVEKNATAQEKANREQEIVQFKTFIAAREAEQKTLRETKIGAYVKLGLTDAEIEAILPTPKTITAPNL